MITQQPEPTPKDTFTISRITGMFASAFPVAQKPERKRHEEEAYSGVVNGELEVDSEGRIWRLARRKKYSSELMILPRRRAEITNTDGYLQVQRWNGKKGVNVAAHRLVWYCFNGPIPDDVEVNHKDRNKQNNRPDNLELITHRQNIQHARDTGWRVRR